MGSSASSGDLLVRLNLERPGRRPIAYLDSPGLHRLRDFLLQDNSQEAVGERRRLDVNMVSQFEATLERLSANAPM